MQLVAKRVFQRTQTFPCTNVSSTHDPDGFLFHAAGPIECLGHKWKLYISSGLDDALPHVMEMNSTSYCLYRDLGCNDGWYLEVSRQGFNLKAYPNAFNTNMDLGGVTIERSSKS